jgi:hypothetical protein
MAIVLVTLFAIVWIVLNPAKTDTVSFACKIELTTALARRFFSSRQKDQHAAAIAGLLKV